MNGAIAVEGTFKEFRTLTNIEVRKVVNPYNYNMMPQYNESICRHFGNSGSAFVDRIHYLNFTGHPIRIMLRDHTEFTITPEPHYSSYSPRQGLYIRRQMVPSENTEVAYALRQTAANDADTPEAKVIRDIISEFRNRKAVTDYISKSHDPTIEYFIPNEKLFSEKGVPLYIHETDAVVAHAHMRLDVPHPFFRSMNGTENIENISKVNKDKYAGFSMFINDINMGYAVRYMAIGGIVIKVQVVTDPELQEGFYIKSFGEFVPGKGDTEAQIKRYSMEEADKTFMLGGTPEEAKTRSHHEQLLLKQKELDLKKEELEIAQAINKAKLSVENKKVNLADIQHGFNERRQVYDERQHAYSKRRDYRSEILDWFKFIFSAIGTLFMIKSALS